MNPIKQKTVLTKTFETMIGLAGNIILQACQWYSPRGGLEGGKVIVGSECLGSQICPLVYFRGIIFNISVSVYTEITVNWKAQILLFTVPC